VKLPAVQPHDCRSGVLFRLPKGTYNGSSGLVSSLLFLQKTPRHGLETEAASSHKMTGEARAPRQRRRFPVALYCSSV
jgi:hypothetical protein